MSESAIPAVPRPPADEKSPGSLNDFSDRLSPMLVKELRQGLRARTFVSVFLSLQILLALFLLAGVGTATPQTAGKFISGMIFSFFSLAVLVVQPLRGVGLLHQEIKDQTLELIALTRLNSWRIVLGKWVSIVSQSALIFIAIVPYLILRYWFGDMNLFGELVALGLVLVGSATLTAITVGLSAVPSVLLRGLLPLVGIIALAFVILQLAFSPFGGLSSIIDNCDLSTRNSRVGVSFYLGMCAFIGWNALGISVSMIAPAAENHSSLRRAITLLLLVGCAVATRIPGIDDWMIGMTTAILAIPVVVLSLSETFFLLPSVCHPFVRRGAAGRFAGFFLYPGWPSGAFFTILVAAITAVTFWSLSPPDPDSEEFAVGITLLGTLLFPAALLGFIPRFAERRFVGYAVLLSTSLIVTFVLQVLAAARGGSPDFLWYFLWIPPIQLVALSENIYSGILQTIVPAACTGFYAVIVLLLALRKLPEIRRVEQAALEVNEPTREPKA